MSTQILKLSEIIIDPRLQMRVSLSEDKISEFQQLLAEGKDLGNPDIVADGTKQYLVDGLMRLKSHERLGLTTITCNVYTGSWQDARDRAFKSNATHGLPRSNADKQRVVAQAVDDYPKSSARKIALKTGLSHTYVLQTKNEMKGKQSPSETNGAKAAVRTKAVRAGGNVSTHAVGCALPSTGSTKEVPVAALATQAVETIQHLISQHLPDQTEPFTQAETEQYARGVTDDLLAAAQQGDVSGFPAGELPILYKDLGRLCRLARIIVWVAATEVCEDGALDEFRRNQLQAFRTVVHQLEEAAGFIDDDELRDTVCDVSDIELKRWAKVQQARAASKDRKEDLPRSGQNVGAA